LMHAPNAAAATSPMTLRWLAQHPVYELIFGGVLYFSNGVETPSEEEVEKIVKASFEDARLEYYVELLQEEGMDIVKVKLDTKLTPPVNANDNGDHESGGSFSWAGLMIGMSSAIGGIGLIAVGARQFSKKRKRQLLIDDLNLDLDLENGSYKDYAIRLQFTNDEIEALPGSSTTVAMTATSDSEDHLSVPSLVRGELEDIAFGNTPGGTNSYSSSSDGETISPLESPQDISDDLAAISAAAAPPAETSTRYISVFTVKKDCGGKPLHQVDIRALAIAYLSRMLKKFPNTHLLPYDKNVPLPAITNIRNIPDDLEELRQYVGNARLDDRTGKVLFNLRVESDEPVSKMKSGGGGGRGLNKLRSSLGKSQKAGVLSNTTVKSSDEMEQEEMPRSPGEFEDVKL